MVQTGEVTTDKLDPLGMIGPAERICALLPSATEIVYALGLGDRLVCVTHECDYPSEARHKPHVTTSVIDSENLTSREIDQAVRNSLADVTTIYHLDRELLDALRPDLVLTQELCDVCAVSWNEVREVVANLRDIPRVVSLEPTTLSDVLDSILLVGRLTGTHRRAIDVRDGLAARLSAMRAALGDVEPVSVLTLEWIDPVFVGGHWVPEMVQIAGGRDVLGQPGKPSRQVSWREILESDPDVVVAMPCGFGVERAWDELSRMEMPPEWHRLRAVHEGRVYVVDGSSYFNRPGPRLIDGVEILASLFHPDVFSHAPPHSYRAFAADAART